MFTYIYIYIYKTIIAMPLFSLAFNSCLRHFIFFENSPNKASAAEGFLLAFYRITFVIQDFPSPPTCLDFNCLAQLLITCDDFLYTSISYRHLLA